MNEAAAETKRMVTVAGTATSRGFVSGPVFLYAGDRDVALPEYTLPAEKVGAELARYREARAETRRQLEGVVTDVSARVTGAEADIFKNHLVMLEDEVIISAIEKLIREERLNVEAALHRVVDKFRASFERMNDPYLRERARDLDDVEKRSCGRSHALGDGHASAPVHPRVRHEQGIRHKPCRPARARHGNPRRHGTRRHHVPRERG